MREESFSLMSSLEANYLNIDLGNSVHMDEIAIHVIKEDCPEFLIPFRIVNVNNKITLKYQLINTIALEYSERKLYKRDFVRLYLDLLIPFIKGKDWFLDYHNLCIDPRYIFLKKQNASALFVYVPESSYQNSDEEILLFFKDTFISMTIQDDADFQVKLYQFFSRKDFTLIDLYQILLQESHNVGVNRSRQEPIQTNSVPASAPMPASVNVPIQPAKPMESAVFPAPVPVMGRKSFLGMEKKQEQKPIIKEVESEAEAPIPALSTMETDDSDGVMEALFGNGKRSGTDKRTTEKASSEKKKEGGFGLFGKKKQTERSRVSPGPSVIQNHSVPQGNAIPQNNPIPQDSPIPAFMGFASVGGEGDDRTEIAFEGNQLEGACLELFESPIPGAISRINLDFLTPFIIIGRMSSDEKQPDVAFSRDFNRIGRKHARIEKKNGIYYVIDLGSANHTLLNGQILIPNQPYQLTDGSELTFTTSKPVRYRVHL